MMLLSEKRLSLCHKIGFVAVCMFLVAECGQLEKKLPANPIAQCNKNSKLSCAESELLLAMSQENERLETGSEEANNGTATVQTKSNLWVELNHLKDETWKFGSVLGKFVVDKAMMEKGRKTREQRVLETLSRKLLNKDKENKDPLDRSVIEWLGRLIGKEGLTLGEFLRDYQIDVLYDVIFLFMKWLFMLYAGTIIP